MRYSGLFVILIFALVLIFIGNEKQEVTEKDTDSTFNYIDGDTMETILDTLRVKIKEEESKVE